MIRRTHRTDAAQAAIVTALRGAGFLVCDLSGAGVLGLPDLLVATRDGSVMRLLEVKNPGAPSRSKLRPSQVLFAAQWAAVARVVRSPTEAVDAMVRTRPTAGRSGARTFGWPVGRT